MKRRISFDRGWVALKGTPTSFFYSTELIAQLRKVFPKRINDRRTIIKGYHERGNGFVNRLFSDVSKDFFSEGCAWLEWNKVLRVFLLGIEQADFLVAWNPPRVNQPYSVVWVHREACIAWKPLTRQVATHRLLVANRCSVRSRWVGWSRRLALIFRTHVKLLGSNGSWRLAV